MAILDLKHLLKFEVAHNMASRNECSIDLSFWEDINSENESSGRLAYVNWQKANALWRNFSMLAIIIIVIPQVLFISRDKK